MQPIPNQLFHFPLSILIPIWGHLVSLHFDQLSRLHQLISFHLPLACACYSSELHDSISAIDYCIGSGKKWSS